MEAAKKRAEEIRLHISVLGVGSTQGGPIPLIDEAGVRRGYQRDQHNEVAISRLDEASLQALTQHYAGWYGALSSTDDYDVAELLRWVRAREAEEGIAYNVPEYGELSMWFSGWSWIALVIAWVL